MKRINGKPGPWLIAAWPGMGNVAVIAAGYLMTQFKMKQAGILPQRDHFDISDIRIKKGVVVRPRLPRGLFFRWNNPRGRDLVIFIGESQPATGNYAYANELLDAALGMGVERVVTFASLASSIHPADNPRVTGIATDPDTLNELLKAEVEPLPDGEIGGLNGLLLGAAAERNIPGICLLAEVPYFAATLPNPKAARVALSVFSILAGIDISLEQLNKHADAVDKALIEAMQKAQEEQEEQGDQDDEQGPDAAALEEAPDEPEFPEPTSQPTGELARREPKMSPDFKAHQQIERLFSEANRDPTRAGALKSELDRLGIFSKYENRFLDLFRRAG